MTTLRPLDQSSKLKNVLYEIRGQALIEAARLESEGHTILKLNTGNPASFGFEAPYQIVRDMIAAMPNAHGYSESRGVLSARRAIVNRYEEIPGFPKFDPDHVFLGNGVSELITMTMQALLDEGDEVLIPAPDYPLWTAMASLSGGTPVHYICDEQNGWQPDLEDIRARITPRTKPAPWRSASRVPIRLPATLATAITAPKCHHTWPLAANSTMAAMLVAQLSSLAEAEAFRKS